jgi:hypothetical protein
MLKTVSAKEFFLLRGAKNAKNIEAKNIDCKWLLLFHPVRNYDMFALFFDHHFLFFFPAQLNDEIARDGYGQRGFAAFGKFADVFILNFSVHIEVLI